MKNNSLNLTDPTGLTYWSNTIFLIDYLIGGGQNSRNYLPGTTENTEVHNSPGFVAIRTEFYSPKECRSFGPTEFEYSTTRGAVDTLLNPYYWGNTALQVGGFRGSAVNNGNGTVTFRIWNEAGAHSFFYHAVGNLPSEYGSFRTIYQYFEFTEVINENNCKCKEK